MPILVLVVSAGNPEPSDRLLKLEGGILDGDLVGGDRSGIHNSDCSIRTFVAWVGFMSHLAESDSALIVEKRKFFMVDNVRHPLW